MTLFENLDVKLKEAMLSRDEFATSVLRGILSAIHNREIEKRAKSEEIVDEDVLEILKREVKKRKEAADLYVKAQRDDLAKKEMKEGEFISLFLPPQMSREEVEKKVDEVLKDFPEATVKEFGKIIRAVMEKCGGGCEGSVVSEILKNKLK